MDFNSAALARPPDGGFEGLSANMMEATRGLGVTTETGDLWNRFCCSPGRIAGDQLPRATEIQPVPTFPEFPRMGVLKSRCSRILRLVEGVLGGAPAFGSPSVSIKGE